MKIILGSTSDSKLKILQEFLKGRNIKIITTEVSSEVTEQPLDKETTVRGSLNRAREALKRQEGNLAIGMEGGLELIDGLYHLTCAVTILDKSGKEKTILSSPIPLPEVVSNKVKNGKAFGAAIREYAKNNNSDLVQELITRRKSFLSALERQDRYFQL